MASKTCMNILCGTTSSVEWKGGWALRSGEVASLCSSCGSAYEQRAFCETFHGDETGWRQCVVCGKQLHCGCVASLNLIEMLDNGGVKCINCSRNGIASEQMPGEFRNPAARDAQISYISTHKESNGTKQPVVPLNSGTNGLPGHKIKEDGFHPHGDPGGAMISSFLAQSSMVLPFKKTVGLLSADKEAKDYGAFISLGGPMRSLQSFCGTSVEGRERGGTTLQQASPSYSILPKTMKSPLSPGVHSDLSLVPHIRIARPPVEGRGRNQLLPRYWPRITEQELQQISGDPNCTIVPLFEKVLSASDAGRIGRLVLPKACAEAYFPPISQPEGLPLKIQDVKGKEWIFQFRFWPNNNSRMYVLEGVTPCIQSMQLQAGDTVIFSRMDPEGKLVMGFRKASTSGTLQSLKESADGQINALPKQMKSAGGHITWNNGERQGGALGDCMLQSPLLPPERKKSRNIGLKSKRLQNESEEAVELKLTWEDVQDMLRAPNVSKPNVVIVEDYEFEEYEEPPVFGKSSIFGIRSSGLVEQWTQCDACMKWRKLPADVLLSSTWTCAENTWDKSRSSCSAPDELTPRELDMFLQLNKGFKKTKLGTSNRISEDQESTELEALANASDPGTSSIATTTKHPRHRPGCSCIVCIQPPSGKGKHKPMCTCNVCSTVKRRFKTLMMRKKKRQSEQEAEQALKTHQTALHRQVDDADADSDAADTADTAARLAVESDTAARLAVESDTAARLAVDLNFGPDSGGDLQVGLPHVSMKSLLQLASLPLENYMKENGLSSLAAEQAAERRVEEDQAADALEELDDQPCLPKQGQTRTQ